MTAPLTDRLTALAAKKADAAAAAKADRLTAIRAMVAATPAELLRATLKAAGHIVWAMDDGDLKTYAVVVFDQRL